MSRVYTDIRDAFFEELYTIARSHRDVIVLSADQGAQTLEKFRRDIPAQFLNTGIAEQNMIGVAAGLALVGKRPFAYAIIPFVTMRCYEQIRVDLCCMELPVTLVGVGAGYAYSSDGPTHHAVHDIAVMRSLPGMQIWNPSDLGMIAALVPHLVERPGPKYIRLDKGGFPAIYGAGADYSIGVASLRSGRDVTIVATGLMVHHALRMAEFLEQHGVAAAVVDLYRIKPMNEGTLLELLAEAPRIVTLEEHSIVGGIGSLVAEVLADHGERRPLKRLAVPDRFSFELGSREHLHSSDGLDLHTVGKTVLQWLE